MNEILISGYYGFKNSGDDALLLAIINDLKKYKKDVRVTVLSSNPKETEKTYGVKAINRLNPFSIISAMLKAKMLISGGGTLIQDGTSTKSLLYYLMVIRLAKLFGLKVMLYSNGVGPINHEKNVKRTKKVLNRVDLITLRDNESCRELEKIGVDKPEIYLTADPAFTLLPAKPESGRDILGMSGADVNKRLLCISVRKWKMLGADFESEIAETVDYAVDKYGFYPVFLPMQLKNDYDISCRIMHKMHSEAAVINKNLSAEDMLSVIGNMDLCIGMRLHTLIYSAAQAVPIIGIAYDPKVSGFMDYTQQKNYCRADKVTVDEMIRLIDKTMSEYTAVKSELETRRMILREKAEENAKYAIRLLDK